MNDQPDLFALPVEPADNEARQPAQVPETTSDTNDKLTATAPEPAEAAIASVQAAYLMGDGPEPGPLIRSEVSP